uniref:Uncharacterized protein n=1 Tax=viral metagenome TaxID=1070528 RepID=A0A6C0K4K7_9ZZZZ
MKKYREDDVDLFVMNLLTKIIDTSKSCPHGSHHSYRSHVATTVHGQGCTRNSIPEKMNHRTIFTPRRNKEQSSL